MSSISDFLTSGGIRAITIRYYPKFVPFGVPSDNYFVITGSIYKDDKWIDYECTSETIKEAVKELKHHFEEANGSNDNLDKLPDEFDARLSSSENKLALTSLESKLAQNPSSMPAVPANVISLKAGLGVAEKFLNAALTLGSPSLNMKMSYSNAAMQLRDLAGLGLFGEWSSRLHLMASVLEDAAKEKAVNEIH